MGGAANSALWTQIKADVTGLPITTAGSDNATTLGAAILAGVGTGFYGSFEEAVRDTVRVQASYTPDPERHAVYEEGYLRYRALYENLKTMMR